ncbi:MAG: NADPH dehydrogenase NamA [Clostridiales bacterium]|uniref:NADPH dehydrogenase NamA n=1 Tax=Clostridium sp. N3C TaxID=1776758 RepID=UPI00092DFF24|nr:NADPH dehydrogenase NamA [Clostridium sp. N3C]NLZ48395.1 NADPH dehydrogenase NamA [Clostridiales bacterium]SCN24251.1 NADPH dehydrogenase [Clostridium sp. N3C]
MAKLFEDIKINGLTIKNRIAMAPMCMYSAGKDGMVEDWHVIHYATRAIGGTGLIIQEATAVESCGRISDRDLGIWKDEHIEGLKRITKCIKDNGAVPAIQLAHAGRKSEVFYEPVIAPSAIAYSNDYKVPEEMKLEDIERVVQSFKKAAERALKAGYEVVEIHAAHGYLINEFLSPLTNKREDEYGGSLENRSRFLRRIIEAVRSVWKKPIIVRVSAEDYEEGGNHPEDLGAILNLVKDLGVDMVNVSSGGVVNVVPKAFPGYQVEFAEKIKKITGLAVMAGGLLTTSEECEGVLAKEKADMIFLGRELLRNPYWPLKAASELQVEVPWPKQYERGRYRVNR